MIYSKKYIEYDFSFLKEITELIIINLTELNDGLTKGNTNKAAQSACNFCRSKITLNLIGNGKLLVSAEQISEILKVKSISEVDPFFIDSFQKLCNKEIKNLSERIKYYERYLISASKIDESN